MSNNSFRDKKHNSGYDSEEAYFHKENAKAIEMIRHKGKAPPPSSMPPHENNVHKFPAPVKHVKQHKRAA